MSGPIGTSSSACHQLQRHTLPPAAKAHPATSTKGTPFKQLHRRTMRQQQQRTRGLCAMAGAVCANQGPALEWHVLVAAMWAASTSKCRRQLLSNVGNSCQQCWQYSQVQVRRSVCMLQPVLPPAHRDKHGQGGCSVFGWQPGKPAAVPPPRHMLEVLVRGCCGPGMGCPPAGVLTAMPAKVREAASASASAAETVPTWVALAGDAW